MQKKSLQFPTTQNYKANLLIVGAILILGTALRLFHLESQSVWFDEAARLLIARGDIRTIALTTGGDTLPPLYHLLLHFWQLAGTQDFWTRLPSVFANILFIAVMFKLGQLLFDRSVGIFAATITAVLPYLVFHSQQANLYSFFVLFSGLQIILFWQMQQDNPTKKVSILYIVINLIALYTHYFAIFILIASHIYLLLQKRIKWTIIFADALILFGYLPYLTIFLDKANEVSSGFWLTPPSLLEPFLTFFLFIGSYSVTDNLYIAGLALVIALLMFSLLELKHHAQIQPRKRPIFLFLLLLTFMPVIIVWIVSQWLPIYLARTLLIILPSYILLLAYAIVHTHRRSPIPYVAILTFFVLAFSLYNYFESPAYWKPNYRAAATAVSNMQTTNSAIIHTSNGSYIPFLVYLPPANHFLLVGDPAPLHPPNVHENVKGSTITQEELNQFDNIIVVVALDHSIDYQKSVVEQLDATYSLVKSITVDKIIIRSYQTEVP